MKRLHKTLLTVAGIAGLGLTTVALSGPWGGPGPMMGGGGDCPMMGHHSRMGGGPMGGNPEQRMAMMKQFHAERMELLAARLKLKPEQETAWKAFLAAQDAHHDAMRKNWQEMRDKDATAMAQFEERIQGMEQHLASMKALAKSAGDLYTTLDPTQKKVMDDFFTRQAKPHLMRGQAGQPLPPTPPAPPAQ